MANPEHLKILRKGVEEWNRWRLANAGVRPDLREAYLAEAWSPHADFLGADLSDADLRGANLQGANLLHTQLSGANLSHAELSKTEFFAADLRRATLSHANFVGADLRRADLSHTNLRGAVLSDADFRSAALSHANLRGANLSGANLSGAKFWGTNFSNAVLSDADFSASSFLTTTLDCSDLRRARGLELAEHVGPSTVSVNTLEWGEGHLPERFLKGCGFPGWAILSAKLYDPDLPPDQVIDITYRIADLRTHAPIVPLSVFVSYAHEDKGFAEEVEQRLDKDGIRFWRDIHHMVAGPMERQIDRAISINGAVLLILSEASVNSDWVLWEAEKARELEKKLKAEAGGEPRHRLCPVSLDKSWETCDWPGWLRSQIKRYNILDFSMWESDEDAFEAQYEKLKTGLGIYYRK